MPTAEQVVQLLSLYSDSEAPAAAPKADKGGKKKGKGKKKR